LPIRETGNGLTQRCWWQCWGKPKIKPVALDAALITISVPAAEERFSQIVQDGPPVSSQAGAQRMDRVRTLLSGMTPEDKQEISRNTTLMRTAEIYVGPSEYISLLGALEMYTNARSANGLEYSLHMSGRDVDQFIEAALDDKTLAHLRPYLQAAIKAGGACQGYLAVLGDADWKQVYRQAFDDPIGAHEELSTNGFTCAAVIILKNDRGTRSTAIHEAIHRLSQDTLYNTWGPSFNEGVTEYFTRLLLTATATQLILADALSINRPGISYAI
jgi:hypothetical protein